MIFSSSCSFPPSSVWRQGGSVHMTDFINIPVSILLGTALGALTGYLLFRFFETAYVRQHYIRNSMKVIIVLGTSFLLMAVETWLKGTVSVSGLLSVVSMACMLKIQSPGSVSNRLSEKFGKLWIGRRSPPLCFSRRRRRYPLYAERGSGGCSHDPPRSALPFRCGLSVSAGHTAHRKRTSLLHHRLPAESHRTGGHRLCSPRHGTPCGEIVLSTAVLAIVITAPLGAIGIGSDLPRRSPTIRRLSRKPFCLSRTFHTEPSDLRTDMPLFRCVPLRTAAAHRAEPNHPGRPHPVQIPSQNCRLFRKRAPPPAVAR